MANQPKRSAVTTFVQRFIWTREILTAFVFVSPAVLAAAGSFVLSSSLDANISEFSSRRAVLTAQMLDLNAVLRKVEDYQLQRGAMLLVLTGQNSDLALRYKMDKLYRLNALGAMRRVAATLYPDDWKTRIDTYEKLVTPDYSDRISIDRMQAIENDLIADAGHALTGMEASFNTLSGRIDEETGTRNAVTTLGNGLMYILTVLLFFLKVHWVDPRRSPPPGPPPPGTGNLG
jgi:hypothetical protein